MLEDINFPVHKLSREELIEMCTEIFNHLGLIDFLKVSRETIWEFFIHIAWRYKRVPYHHFTHAVCLVKLMYWVLTRIEIENFFTKIDLVGIFISALAHDIDHSSMNNAFYVKTRDTLALMYNDQSVLENYHVSLLYQIMQNDTSIDIFKFLDPS